MPSLVLFGRRWGIGSDDLVFPSLIDLIIRGICLAVSGIILAKNYEIFECTRTKYLLMLFVGMVHASIILDAFVMFWSRQGGIMEIEKRTNVFKYLYLRIFVEMCFISWNILNTVIHGFNFFQTCLEKDEIHKFMLGLITFNWILLGFQFFFLVYTYDILGSTKKQFLPIDENHEGKTHAQLYVPKSKNTHYWRKRIHLYTCRCCESSQPEDNRESVRELARLLGHGFGNEDLVHSDVIAGLILLGIKHRREKRIRRSMKKEWREWNHGNQIRILSEPKSLRDVGDWSGDWRSFKHLSHFFKYASAIFGWHIVVLQQTHPFQILKRHMTCSNCLPCKKYPVDVEGDNCCFLNTAGLKATIDAEFKDIIYVSFRNHLFQVPFFVSLDHVTGSIVLTCRGSMSINDVLLDLTGWPVQIEGYPENFKAHRGMYTACVRIKEKLDKLNVFPRLFSAYPNYNFVLTGHSLGSGCAAILSMMYLPHYPNLKCYSYSPPGGLLSKPAAEFCDDFVTSVTYGDDFVTRLGILQAERLRFKMLEVLKESRIPKYRLLMRTFPFCKPGDDITWLDSCSNDYSRNIENSEDNGNILPTLSKDFTSTIVTPADNCSHDLPNKKKFRLQAHPNTKFPSIDGMYPPGKIIYIRRLPKTKFGKNSNADVSPKWMWRWADRTEFDDIIISKRMFLDHFPFIIPKSLSYFEKYY